LGLQRIRETASLIVAMGVRSSCETLEMKADRKRSRVLSWLTSCTATTAVAPWASAASNAPASGGLSTTGLATISRSRPASSRNLSGRSDACAARPATASRNRATSCAGRVSPSQRLATGFGAHDRPTGIRDHDAVAGAVEDGLQPGILRLQLRRAPGHALLQLGRMFGQGLVQAHPLENSRQLAGKRLQQA